MRVGYMGGYARSGLNLYEVESLCREKELDVLIFCGGISHDYKKSMEIINRLGWELESKKIKFRFVVDTSDLYYPQDEVELDKERKVRKILSLYDESEYSLKNHPILQGKAFIFSANSHYDYTYYRGKPIELSKVTRKQKWWYKNQDVQYLTSKEDYTLGVRNVFDVRYTKELNGELVRRLNDSLRMYGNSFRRVACTNIIPHKTFLGGGVMGKYRGTFSGNIGFHEILNAQEVSECHFGAYSPVGYARVGNVDYYGCHVESPSGVLEVVDYD